MKKILNHVTPDSSHSLVILSTLANECFMFFFLKKKFYRHRGLFALWVFLFFRPTAKSSEVCDYRTRNQSSFSDFHLASSKKNFIRVARYHQIKGVGFAEPVDIGRMEDHGSRYWIYIDTIRGVWDADADVGFWRYTAWMVRRAWHGMDRGKIPEWASMCLGAGLIAMIQ